MAALTVAPAVACAVGLAVESTRWLGVLCAALLGWRYPVPFAVLLPLAVGAFLFVNRRRNSP